MDVYEFLSSELHKLIIDVHFNKQLQTTSYNIIKALTCLCQFAVIHVVGIPDKKQRVYQNYLQYQDTCSMDKTIRQFGVKEPTSFTSVKWSSHSPGLLACGTAANFGVVGKGGVVVKSLEGQLLKTIAASQEPQAIFDVSWFELNEKFILLGGGNGEISFWQIGKGKAWIIPGKSQIVSVECAYKNPLFIAGSLNGVLHVGSTQNGKLLFSLPAHTKNCNQVQWHPTSDKVFASCGADGLLKLWDHTLPKPNISSHRANESEILTLDFNKYDQHIATGSTDKTIRLWDLRNLTKPVNILAHHRYPPKKVRFSPHLGWLLGSCGYDMNVHFYDLRDAVEPLKFKYSNHSEFVPSMDFSLFDQKLVASAGWDGRLLVWDFDRPQPLVT